MIPKYKKILYPIEKKDLNRFIYLIILTIISASFDFLGIALIIPLLSILAGFDYQQYASYFPFKGEREDLILIILIVLFIIYLTKFFFQSILIFFRNNFTQKLYTTISKKILTKYLYMNYMFHVQNNSSNLIRNVNSETSIFCNNILLSILKIISDIIIFISISVLLIIFNPMVALVAVLFLLFSGFIFFKITSNSIKKWGKIRQLHAGEVIKQMQQSLSSIREIIIFGAQEYFIKNYNFHNIKFSKSTRNRDTLSQLSRGILEFLGVTTFIILIFYLMMVQNNISDIIVIVGVFAAAISRLLPSVSSLVTLSQLIKFNSPAIDLVYKELTIKEDLKENNNNILEFKNSLELKNVSYKYPGADENILKDVNIKINQGDKIGIIGGTGSGKTTLINLVSGLLSPLTGEINVDGVLLKDENLSSWTKNLSYVPQAVYLTDETILKNITFGLDEKVQKEKIDEILNVVELFNFVNSLKDKYNSIVGEKGAKISGGQAQRIGIARALYRNSSVIILDESTNELDEQTEKKLLKKLYEYKSKNTIITISHNLKNLYFCNKIFKIMDGKILETKNEKHI